jgi:hypothetical protein
MSMAAASIFGLSADFKISLAESSLYKIDHFLSADCRIIDNHEGQEAYSQTDTGRPLPDLWRGAGAEVRTQHRAASYRAAP